MELRRQVILWKLAVVGCVFVMVLMAWVIRRQRAAVAELCDHAVARAAQGRYLISATADTEKGDIYRQAVLCLLQDTRLDEAAAIRAIGSQWRQSLAASADESRAAISAPHLARALEELRREIPELNRLTH